jgi:hypothetical protein
MAAVNAEARIEITFGGFCILTKTEYIWTTKADIQRYLNDESVIQIGDGTGDTYPEVDAQGMENAVVREVVTYLSSVYEIDEDSNIPLLKDIAAMWTAARIGIAFSSAISNDPTSWAYRYENEVWASLQQRFVNQDIADLTKVTKPLWQRLMFGKRRERAVQQETR